MMPRSASPEHAPYVLVAEDEQALADMVRTFLEDEGYRVKVANDGDAALRMIAHEPPDLVLADVMMPRLDGFGLTRELRHRGCFTPVVLMSAVFAGNGPAGVRMVSKPFDLDDLLSELESVLHEASWS